MTANSLQFEMAESSRVAAERLNEAMRMKSLLEEKKEGGDEAVAVAAVKVELAKKEEEVADLKQLLEEASVEFLMLGRANYRLEEREARLEEVEANLEAGQSKLGEDFGSGLEVVDLKERVEKLEGELQGERELLKEQKVKAEEAKAQASNLQCQLDEMRGATSVDDSALMEEEVATLREEF